MNVETQYVRPLVVILLTLTVGTVSIFVGEKAVAAPVLTAHTNEHLAEQALSSTEALRWPRPMLENPTIIDVPANSSTRLINLNPQHDYILNMPDTVVTRGLVILGGRNVVMIGGEIYIPWQGDNPSIASRTALKIKDVTGIVHIEGVLMHGSDISEGIQIDAPRAIVQLQNIGIFNLRARDQIYFSDNHPDLVQTYGNVTELRIDRLTGSTDYQGLFLNANFGGPHGDIHLSRINILGEETARQLIWFGVQEGARPIILEDVWIHVPEWKEFSNSVWPSSQGSFPTQAQIGTSTENVAYATWPEEMTPQVNGKVFHGIPPGGSFVDPENIGINYSDMETSELMTKLVPVSAPEALTELSQLHVMASMIPLVNGTTWKALDGWISYPLINRNGVVYQEVLTTNPSEGGSARYRFVVEEAGDYVVNAVIDAPSDSYNSFFVNIDSEPDEAMVWHIELTHGFEKRSVSHALVAGMNTPPKVFTLEAGEHVLFLRGREKNVKLSHVSLALVE